MKLPMEMTLAQVAAVIGGRVQGPADLKVSSVAPSPCRPPLTILLLFLKRNC